tara:strand:+ start:1034 stop:1306 length:273 start_codon:yes stop_codon:yes gene_type:complete
MASRRRLIDRQVSKIEKAALGDLSGFFFGIMWPELVGSFFHGFADAFNVAANALNCIARTDGQHERNGESKTEPIFHKYLRKAECWTYCA